MTGWIILGIYLLGYVRMWRTVTWTLLSEIVYGQPDGVYVTIACFFGTIVTLFWPAICSGILLRRIYQARGHEGLAFVMPRSVRRQRELAAKEQRIASLERELGIR